MAKDKLSYWDALVHGVDLQIGKPVMYILTSEESGETMPVKALAFVCWIGQGPPATVDLTILRSPRHGGIFQKTDVRFTEGRDPGTCDTIAEGDVGSLKA